MKKLLIVLTALVFSMIMMSCNSYSNIDYDVTESTLEFPYTNYQINDELNPLFYSDLIPVTNSSGLIGYINSEGEIVVDFQYTTAKPHNAYGYALVSNNGNENIIDTSGNKIFAEDLNIESIYYSDDYIYIMNSNSNIVYNYNGETLYSYLSYDDVIEDYPEFKGFGKSIYVSGSVDQDYLYNGDTLVYIASEIIIKTNGYASIKNGNDKYGAIDLEGNLIAEALYAYEVEFGSYDAFSDIATIRTGEYSLGFIDNEGNIIVEPEHYKITSDNTPKSEFYYGVQKVTDRDYGDDLIIDYQGNVLFRAQDNQVVTDYTAELIAVENSFDDFDITEVIDYTGKVIYSTKENVEVSFTIDESDVFFVAKDYETIDIGGRDIFSYYIADMYDYSGDLIKENVYYNACGNERISFNGDYYLSTFFNGLMASYDPETEKIGFINSSGEWIIEPQYDYDQSSIWDIEAYKFHSDGYAVVYKDGYYGIIDSEGNLVYDCSLLVSPTEQSDNYNMYVQGDNYTKIGS